MDMFQVLASMASIISIPLAIYFARKNNNTTSEKARLDILKTLSYRLSSAHTLTYKDIDSVYKSKLREHEIVHAKFNQEDILNDLKSDIMSNAFLENEVRNKILYNLSSIEFVHTSEFIYHIPNFLNPFIKLFFSPIPNILLITSIIACTILLCPYIFDIIIYALSCRYLDYQFLQEELNYIYKNDIYLIISLICLLSFSIICCYRKKYLKKYF